MNSPVTLITSKPSQQSTAGEVIDSDGSQSTSAADVRCAICLDQIKDTSFLDLCFHRFCFLCIMKWTEVNHSCPLCKMTFKSIIHNVRSIYDYDQIDVHEEEAGTQGATRSQPAFSETMEDGRRFRYSSTMTGDWQGSATAVSNTREHQVAAATSRSSARSATASAVTPRSSVRQRRQQASVLRRRMVYFDGLTTRLPREQAQRQRDISATFFRRNPAATHRLSPWITRDLGIILHRNTENVNFVADFIINLVSRLDMDSPDFADQLESFLHDKTHAFIHELLSFARSPFDMTGYDSACIYDNQAGAVPTVAAGATEQVLRDTNQGHLQQAIFEDLASASWETPCIAVPETDRAASPDIVITASSWSDSESVGNDHDDSVVVIAVYTPNTARTQRSSSTSVISIASDSESGGNAEAPSVALSPVQVDDSYTQLLPSSGPAASDMFLPKAPKQETARKARNSPVWAVQEECSGEPTECSATRKCFTAASSVSACSSVTSPSAESQLRDSTHQAAPLRADRKSHLAVKSENRTQHRSPSSSANSRSPSPLRRKRASRSQSKVHTEPCRSRSKSRERGGKKCESERTRHRRTRSSSSSADSSQHSRRSRHSRHHSRSCSRSPTRYRSPRRRRPHICTRHRTGTVGSTHSPSGSRSPPRRKSQAWTSHSATSPVTQHPRHESRLPRRQSSGDLSSPGKHGAVPTSSRGSRSNTNGRSPRGPPYRSHGILRDDSAPPELDDGVASAAGERKPSLASVVVRVTRSRTAHCRPHLTDEVRWLESQQQDLQSELRSTRSKALRLLTRLETLSGSSACATADREDPELEKLQQEHQQLEKDIVTVKKALLHVMNKLEQAAPRQEDSLDDSQRLTV